MPKQWAYWYVVIRKFISILNLIFTASNCKCPMYKPKAGGSALSKENLAPAAAQSEPAALAVENHGTFFTLCFIGHV